MSRSIFSWRRWGGASLACCMTVLAAFVIPVRTPEGGAKTGPGELLPEALIEVERENLGAFLEIRRWSVPGESPTGLPVPPAEPAGQPDLSINPILVKMGYVGLISARGRHAVLLALPGGKVVRMVPGDTLPDGRILVSVTDNSLTLKAEGQLEEVLTLFPHAEREVRARDGDGGAGRQVAHERAAPRVPKRELGSRQ